MIKALRGRPKLASAQFAKDAAAGKLPSVSWVYAPTGFSEYPVENVTSGMQWTVDQLNAIVQGGLWPKTAIFITWDDWGGWWTMSLRQKSKSGRTERSFGTARAWAAWC
jgi:phospholipase C